MAWVKGQSGNPKGRTPRAQDTAEIIQAIGALKYHGSSQTYKERAALVLWEKAAKGDLAAFQWLTERSEGKTPKQLQIGLKGPVVFQPFAAAPSLPPPPLASVSEVPTQPVAEDAQFRPTEPPDPVRPVAEAAGGHASPGADAPGAR